jgi:hypothetical protein
VTVKTLVKGGNYTPQQVITDLQNQVEDISDLAIVIRWKNGRASPALTKMSLERALTMFYYGVDHTMGKLRGRIPLDNRGPTA